MALLMTPPSDGTFVASDFKLLGTDDKFYSLNDVRGENGTLVMFICNHCPWVREIVGTIVDTAKLLRNEKIESVAIMPNDVVEYPQDSFHNMKIFAQENNFDFPYLIDETQQVATNYCAVCTPDFFLFDSKLKLRYRGQLIDKITKNNDLLQAAISIVKTGSYGLKERPSMGCSIKWKE